VSERLILFDLDNTLIDRASGFTTWARSFASGRSLGGAPEVEWLERLDNDGLTPRTDFFAAARQRYRLRDSVDELVAAYRIEYPRCMPPLPEETRSALRTLRAAGWKIGIATNGAPSQESKITACGLGELVDGWAISEVVGARKPDRAHFAAAATSCGAELTGAWMVGDSAAADIAGAAACGLSTAWIARGRTWADSTYEPDVVAASIAEAVVAILARTS
jgi:putative hydrolase of the HAD superfamily